MLMSFVGDSNELRLWRRARVPDALLSVKTFLSLRCMPESRRPLHHYITPSTWPVWLGLGLLRLVCLLPHRTALAIGRITGRLAHRLAGSRRAVVRRNIGLCFPDFDEQQRDALALEHFEALGMSLIEMGLARFASDAHHQKIARLSIFFLPCL